MDLVKTDKMVEEAISADMRAKNCLVDVKRVLERWNCRINPMVQISGAGISTNFQIVPLTDIPNIGGGNGKG